MNEQAPAGRGLEDISHYFLTEKKEMGDSGQKEVPVQKTQIKNIVLLGDAADGRAVLASNLAAQWSLEQQDVELIEEHTSVQNAHFFIGNRLESGPAGSIALTKWEPNANLFAGKGEWVLWNLGMPSLLKLLNGFTEPPLFLVVLENKREKLIRTYIQIKNVIKVLPEARFIAIGYTNQSESHSNNCLQFIQKCCRQFLNIDIQNGGHLQKDVVLAKSILRRVPVVLFPEEGLPAKAVLKNLAQQCLERFQN